MAPCSKEIAASTSGVDLVTWLAGSVPREEVRQGIAGPGVGGEQLPGLGETAQRLGTIEGRPVAEAQFVLSGDVTTDSSTPTARRARP